MTTVGSLRTEYLSCPLGLDVLEPRLGWVLSSLERGVRQSAYQVLVASSAADLERDRGDVWDTGKVASEKSVHVVYEGRPLADATRYHWKVRVWDEADTPSAWSEPAWWEMGLLGADAWTGSWIGGPPPASADSQPSPFLRRTFTPSGPVASARLYATALGLYELHLNGRRVGQDVLTPGWTDYNQRVEYLTYDVTDHLRAGENTLGAILGDGWACGYLVWENNNRLWSEQPLLLAQLVLSYEDGTRETIATDADWRTTTGPLLASDLYNGERYDARLELNGWAEPGFGDAEWEKVTLPEQTRRNLIAKRMPPVRAVADITPVTLTEPQQGRYIFDLGQNIVGWARLRAQGEAGREVTLRFAERLNPDGTLYTEALRTAEATDTYIFKGQGEEVYEPRFTFHGFQYVEVTGLSTPPTLDAVMGVVLHTDLPQTGQFECSDPLVNQLQSNILWGQKGNFLEVPTDCPQRDERLGWTGDAQVFIRTACFNLDVAPFFTKWLIDVEDAQLGDGSVPHVVPNVVPGSGAAAWADAVVICPWTIYLWYGDTRVLETHYAAMTGWLEYMETTSDAFVRPAEGFGDWLATNAKTPDDAPTPKDLIGTAYFAHCAELMTNIAAVLGREADRKRFEALAETVKTAFNHAFVTESGRLVGHTQTGYLLALAFDLLPEAKREVALAHLVSDLEKRGWHLTTGFVGTPLLAPTLSRFGRTDVAYKLLMQTSYPSWLFPVTQGATTMWERWDGWHPERGFAPASMNSFNHYAYGAVGEWLYATVAGLDFDPERPGYKHVRIRPQPGGGLTSARAELLTVYGPVVSDWHLGDEGFELRVDIPANTTATVTLPAASAQAVTESNEPLGSVAGIEILEEDAQHVTLELGSGSYAFRVRQRERASPQKG